MDTIKFPIGVATRLTPDYAATVELAISNTKTIAEIGVLTGNIQIDLDIDPETMDGAELTIRTTQDATGARAITLGDGFRASDDNPPASAASDVDVITAEYNASTGLFEVTSMTKTHNEV